MPFFQFFASSNIKMTVTFDNPHCYPGGEMSGKVTVNVSKETAIRALVLKYQIVEHHEQVMGPLVDEIKGGKYADNKANETLPILHERELTLYGDTKVGEVSVKAGSYDYEFRVPIPANAPPTMNEPFLTGVRDSCYCVCCDMKECNCQCCGLKVAQALTIQHRVVAEVVVPRSSDKTSKVQNVPRVVGVYPANRFPPSLVVKQSEKSYQFDQCRMCPCHSMETSQQADFTMMAPRPYVLLSRGSHGQMDIFVRGKVNSAFDIMLVRFAREIEPQSASSEKVFSDRQAGADDRHLGDYRYVPLLHGGGLFTRHVPVIRETSQVIASVHSGPLDEQSDPGRKLTLSYDHNMFSNMCTYIGRGVTVVYGLVLRMDYEGACCGGVDTMRESRLPVTVVHDCGFVPENDYNFHAQDPPNCGPNLSASNRPMATSQMGQGFGQQPQQQPPQQQHGSPMMMHPPQHHHMMHHHHHSQHHGSPMQMHPPQHNQQQHHPHPVYPQQQHSGSFQQGPPPQGQPHLQQQMYHHHHNQHQGSPHGCPPQHQGPPPPHHGGYMAGPPSGPYDGPNSGSPTDLPPTKQYSEKEQPSAFDAAEKPHRDHPHQPSSTE